MLLLSLAAAVSPFPINLAIELAQVSHGVLVDFLLALVSLVGAISFSALSGTPLDINSVSSILQIAVEAFAAFFAAHGSYSIITGGTASSQPTTNTVQVLG